jgi:hypothetical protein
MLLRFNLYLSRHMRPQEQTGIDVGGINTSVLA